MPAAKNEQAILNKLFQLPDPNGVSRTELAKQLGISLTKLYELLTVWTRAGLIVVRPARGPVIIRNYSADTSPDHSPDSPADTCPDTCPDSGGVGKSPNHGGGTVLLFPSPPSSPPLQSPLIAPTLQASDSLRSSEPAQAALPKPESGSRSKMKFKLESGEKVGSLDMVRQSMRLTPGEVEKILSRSCWGLIRKAMFKTMARVMEDKYIEAWAEAHHRPRKAWFTKPEAKPKFRQAAELWAGEYARTGLTMGNFVYAAEEMCPNALKFPTPAMMSGAWISDRIQAWIPPEERSRGKINSWTDKDGQVWVDTDDGPVQYTG